MRSWMDVRWKADGALDTKVLGLGTVDEFSADLLDRLYIAAGKSDANLVDFLGSALAY
jgi:hypothetical protein